MSIGVAFSPSITDFPEETDSLQEEGKQRDKLVPIDHWRRACHEDVPHIVKLFRVPHTRELYGSVDVDLQIEMAHTALTQLNTVGSIVSYLALFDWPNIPAVPSYFWLGWIKNLYGSLYGEGRRLENTTERNTLFLHLLVWKSEYSHEFLRPLLVSIFLDNVYLSQIVVVLPPRVSPPDVLQEFFTEVAPLESSCQSAEAAKLQRLLLCVRYCVVPRMRIRKAVEEDNDYITPIFNKMTERLVESYGEYYIAELISHPTEGRKCIVAERLERACGFMCLNSDVNLALLAEYFELGPFNGLHKPDSRDYIPPHEMQHVDSREDLRVSAEDSERSSIASRVSAVLDVILEPAPEGSSSEGSEDFIIVPEDSSTLNRLFTSESSSSGSSSGSSYTSGSSASAIVRARMNTIVDTDFWRLDAWLPSHEMRAAGHGQGLASYVYFGGANAFAIDLFGMLEEVDERLAYDFLEAAFECFPNLDFAFLTLTSAFPTFPLLQHFVRVPPRNLRNFPHELYVAHKVSVFGEMAVRVAQPQDMIGCKRLVTLAPGSDDLLLSFSDAVNRSWGPRRAFVLTAEGTIVGVAVIEPEEDVDYLRAHYEMDRWVDLRLHRWGRHAEIRHALVSPVFRTHSKFFLREVHRLSDASCLYYNIYPRDYMWRDRLPISPIGDMIPVRPRRILRFALHALGSLSRPDEAVVGKDVSHAIYFMGKRHSTVTRREINARIVVVGASDCALAFLETLLFGPTAAFLIFTNVTLVSAHGLPDDTARSRAVGMLIPYRGRYSPSYLARLQLRTWVNLVYNVMTGIDRQKKTVTVGDGALLPYDYLVLMCGQQFQKPVITKRAHRTIGPGVQACFRDRKRMQDENSVPLENVFLINTCIDAANAVTVMTQIIRREKDNPVVVYGHCVEALSCIAALQEMGVANRNIVLVEPFPQTPHAVSFFNDAEVDEAMMNTLKESGVTVHTSYVFTNWELNAQENKVQKVMFESTTRAIMINCAALCYFGEKNVSPSTFLALNRSSLVYDGRLVIDNRYRTTDNSILAAGPLTKYARRYYADDKRHCYYSSVEIGEEVAWQLMEQLDPQSQYLRAAREDAIAAYNKQLHEEEDRERAEKPWLFVGRRLSRRRTRESIITGVEPDDSLLVPRFTRPIIVAASLPCGYNYLSVTKPGKPVPLEAAMSQDSYGQVLVTGDCRSDQGYFRLHFNANNLVETITCYTRGKIAVDNIVRLYGKHERALNNVMERFEVGYVLDFFEYFEEPWACAIFHDRFEWLEVALRKYMASVPFMNSACILNDLVRTLIISKDANVQKQRMDNLEREFLGSRLELLMAQEILRFIHNNSEMLPMYAHPMRVRELLQGFLYSPLHRPPRPATPPPSSAPSSPPAEDAAAGKSSGPPAAAKTSIGSEDAAETHSQSLDAAASPDAPPSPTASSSVASSSPVDGPDSPEGAFEEEHHNLSPSPSF